MGQFFQQHPFAKRLVQKFISIGVAWTAVIVCIIVTIFVLGVLFGGSAEPEETPNYEPVYGDGTNQLLSVKVSGVIMGTEALDMGIFGGGGETAGYAVKEQLYAAAEDDAINGVVLEVSSPGGTIYGSRAIADGVEYYKKKTGNPVYGYVEGQAASGGYWAISATDKIIADFGSDVGSIGVIMGPFQYYDGLVAQDGGLLAGGVVTQRGIQNTYITAGKSKDVGSPYRKLTGEELASLQTSINNEYTNFVQYVSKRRNIPEATLRTTIGALPYDNKTAQDYKLIDQTGSREHAYTELAKEAGIEDDFTVVREKHALGFVDSLLESYVYKPQPKTATDTCKLTRSILAYHGDVTGFCTTKQ